ncbi:cation-translocating P-type ATPase [Liquorilactobacillus uvarum]|uniref:H+-K+-exchanging ATPase n=1 Tax=Liquorilactobacillus uvarum DSM 19971 TaxID=1423812 RepID=A0A0R1Q805_9LACO|nr:cation-transporting P-type ATPase [Liquorilactobacillus uvarum]KRL37032.1 H+-K+-exchanging ATPase [Liquorilactobacillus uvarum DSM 19971]
MIKKRIGTNDVASSSKKELFKLLESSMQGLDDTEARRRLADFGANEIQQSKKRSQLQVFVKNFVSLMALLLWVSGTIALLAGMPELGVAIWLVNIINGLFSFWQEYAAQKATNSLEKMLPTYTTVIRNNNNRRINAQDLVPGDVFVIQAGNSIPADARVLSAESLEIDESALTGESETATKDQNYAKTEGKFGQNNIIYAGTTVARGTATAVAFNTGMETEFGKITNLTQKQGKLKSPLQLELNRLTKQISVIAIIIGVVFLIAAVFFVHYPWTKSFVFALGMIVAFIPEGLLPTVTLSLAQGVQRMSKKHALVKELSSVETLGETSVIASDKTGTLTQNQMTVNHLWLPDNNFEVTGEGYSNNGQVQIKQQKVDIEKYPDLKLLLTISALNNDSKIEKTTEKKTKVIGTPTEAAHIIVAEKAELEIPQLVKEQPRLKELPFDSGRKLMTTIHSVNGKNIAYVKGALSSIMQRSGKIRINGEVRTLNNDDRKSIEDANRHYASMGLRSLALAYRELNENEMEIADQNNIENRLVFVGLTVMADPPRPEIYAAIKKCHDAKIRVIMVTGDSALTAKSVALKIGMISEDARVITGNELEKMDDQALRDAVKQEIVFARVAPEHKYRIVKACQANGEIVASTGDGVNDAPALKQADIGIAMGVTGTDVAKDAADMILTDDNFASIVAAVEEGRTVYSNIQKFLLYILNSNVPEAIPSVLFLLSRGMIPLPLTVMQILTVDLGTDMLPALGLGAEKSEPGVMEQPPRARNSHLLARSVIWKAFAWYGAAAALISTFAYLFVNYMHGYTITNLSENGEVYVQATTMTLAAIVFCQIAAAINCRTEKTSVFTIGLFSNRHIIRGIVVEIALLSSLMYVPVLQELFNTTAIGLTEWIFLAAIPLPLILVEEIRKYFVRLRAAKNKNS